MDAPARVMTVWEKEQVNVPGAFTATGLAARREARREELRRHDVARAWQSAGKPIGAGAMISKAFASEGEMKRSKDAEAYLARVHHAEAALKATKAKRTERRAGVLTAHSNDVRHAKRRGSASRARSSS